MSYFLEVAPSFLLYDLCMHCIARFMNYVMHFSSIQSQKKEIESMCRTMPRCVLGPKKTFKVKLGLTH